MLWQIQQYWSRQQAKRHWIIFIAGLLLLSAGLASFNGLGQYDRVIADLATRLDTRAPSADIVIITIDNESLADPLLDGWPWERSKHAELLDKLQQTNTKAIGLDIVFDQPGKTGKQADMTLAQALKNTRAVVLPLFMYRPTEGSGWIEVVKPLDIFVESVSAIGHVNVEPDNDGKVRNIQLRKGLNSSIGGVWDYMALALVKLAEEKEVEIPGQRAPENVRQTLDKVEHGDTDSHAMHEGILGDYQMLISFAGPPGSFKRYSYIDVYSGITPIDEFEGKYVLVGTTATALGDVHATPMANEEALMPGVEILANVLDSLLQKEFRYSATVFQNILFNLFPILLAIPLFYFCKPRTIILGLFCIGVLDLVAMFLFRRYVGIQVAPVASLICLMLSYPWWSWRRLEMSMRQIKEEFVRMRRENGFFQAPKRMVGDQLERSMQEFNNAAWQLRELQQMIRSSFDELPHTVLITNEHTQVILSNTQARKLFRTDPPLPTMAFEPAMGFEDDKIQTGIAQHFLAVLLKESFLQNLEQQCHENPYAQKLLAFLNQAEAFPPTGSIDLIDNKDGRRYLLKIAPRSSFTESSQGWLVSLVNLSGGQYAEQQRDQLLRYLFEHIKPELELLAKTEMSSEESRKNILFLTSQVNAFLDLQYAQIAIYFYEQINLAECVNNAIQSIQQKLDLQNWDHTLLKLPDHFCIRADANLFEKAIEELTLLLVKLQGTHKMPLIRLKSIENKTDDGLSVHAFQLYFIISVQNDDDFANKSAFFEMQLQNKFFPVDARPEALYWWSIRTTLMRHGAQIKINRTPRALGIIIELPYDKDIEQTPGNGT